MLFHLTFIVVVRKTVRESPTARSGASGPLGSLNRAAFDALFRISWSPLSKESRDDLRFRNVNYESLAKLGPVQR